MVKRTSQWISIKINDSINMKMINTWHEMLFVINGESLSPFENEINVFEVIVLVLIILQISPSLKSKRFGIDRFV